MQSASLLESVVMIPNTPGINNKIDAINKILFFEKIFSFSKTSTVIIQSGPSKAYKYKGDAIKNPLTEYNQKPGLKNSDSRPAPPNQNLSSNQTISEIINGINNLKSIFLL